MQEIKDEGICTKIITANELKRQLKLYNEWGDIKYIITEEFPKHGKRTYKVTNLTCEMNKIGLNKVLRFIDDQKIIQEDNSRVSNMFLIDSQTKITSSCYKDSNKANLKIILRDGTIDIDTIIEY